MKARSLVVALAGAAVWLCFEQSCAAAETNPPKSGVSYFAIGSPVVKLQMTTKGVYFEPNFVPGPGAGYIWDDGKWGVVFYPGFGMFDRGDLSLTPHVTFHAYILSVGVGYECRFARTNDNQATRLQAGFPILTAGLSVPFMAWMEKK